MKLSAGDELIFEKVRSRFEERDRALGRKLFSSADWSRTRIAFGLSADLRRVGDVGIGQGQLINLLSARPQADQVYGFDFTRHTKLLTPDQNANCKIILWNITQELDQKLEPLDLIFAMEIFEHIDPTILESTVNRVSGLAKNGNLFLTVPYQEKEPLYHFDKPHGHKQSFNDDTLVKFFGNEIIWTNIRKRWYCVFRSDKLSVFGPQNLEEFQTIILDCLSS